MRSPFLEDQEVIAPDERRRVTDTLAVPYRWVCSLDVTYPDGALARGTGTLVGPRHVLTAAHNVYRPDGSSPTSVHVAPGRSGRVDPLGRVKAVAYSVSAAFLRTSRAGSRFDVAVLTLERDVSALRHPRIRGRMGHWGHPEDGGGTVLDPVDPSALTGRQVVVCGYPGDWCGGAPLDRSRGCDRRDHATVQLAHHGAARFVPGLTGVLLHTADTHRGQSGSPVWVRSAGDRRNLVGVHVDAHRVQDAVTGQQRPVTANRAVHLSAELLQLVHSWIR